ADVFFFQAEDGIRDFHVTGVQTCALPIYSFSIFQSEVRCVESRLAARDARRFAGASELPPELCAAYRPIEWHTDFRSGHRWDPRSEERRVGKEGSCRGSPRQARERT